MAQPDRMLGRPQVELLLHSRLRQADGISSIYAQFEPNGYDGRDADWQGARVTRLPARAAWRSTSPGNRTET